MTQTSLRATDKDAVKLSMDWMNVSNLQSQSGILNTGDALSLMLAQAALQAGPREKRTMSNCDLSLCCCESHPPAVARFDTHSFVARSCHRARRLQTMLLPVEENAGQHMMLAMHGTGTRHESCHTARKRNRQKVRLAIRFSFFG